MTGKAHGHETNNLKLPRNTCFVCGPDNPEGMRLTFTLDEERSTFVCEFNLGDRYTGPPGHCHDRATTGVQRTVVLSAPDVAR